MPRLLNLPVLTWFVGPCLWRGLALALGWALLGLSSGVALAQGGPSFVVDTSLGYNDGTLVETVFPVGGGMSGYAVVFGTRTATDTSAPQAEFAVYDIINGAGGTASLGPMRYRRWVWPRAAFQQQVASVLQAEDAGRMVLALVERASTGPAAGMAQTWVLEFDVTHDPTPVAVPILDTIHLFHPTEGRAGHMLCFGGGDSLLPAFRGFVVAGFAGSAALGNQAWVARVIETSPTAPKWQLAWERLLGGPLADDAVALAVLPTQSILLGTNALSATDSYDAKVYRLDANGYVKDSLTIGGQYIQGAQTGVVQPVGNTDLRLVLLGEVDAPPSVPGGLPPGPFDGWAACVDTVPALLWTATYGKANVGEAFFGGMRVAHGGTLALGSAGGKALSVLIDSNGVVVQTSEAKLPGGSTYLYDGAPLAPNTLLVVGTLTGLPDPLNAADVALGTWNKATALAAPAPLLAEGQCPWPPAFDAQVRVVDVLGRVVFAGEFGRMPRGQGVVWVVADGCAGRGVVLGW